MNEMIHDWCYSDWHFRGRGEKHFRGEVIVGQPEKEKEDFIKEEEFKVK